MKYISSRFIRQNNFIIIFAIDTCNNCQVSLGDQKIQFEFNGQSSPVLLNCLVVKLKVTPIATEELVVFAMGEVVVRSCHFLVPCRFVVCLWHAGR